MPSSQQPHSQLERYFSGLAEYTFQVHLGVADPDLVDYISDLLVRFVRMDAVSRVRSRRGRPLLNVAELFAEAEQRVGLARREVHRHIGDLALFWAGLFPESLRPKSPRDPVDRFADYCRHGKRSYLIAATIEVEEPEEETGKQVPGDLLERLGIHFELCAYGLREVRREWEERSDDDPEYPGPYHLG